MSATVDYLIAHGGIFLFLVGLLDQIGLSILGAPFIVVAGALAASGKLTLLAVIGWTAAGCITADSLLFVLGNHGKARVLRAFPHLQAVQVRLERATRAESMLHGLRMLILAKFLPWGQVMAMHAGAMKVNRLRFLLVDAFSAVAYATVFASLGFAFHEQLEQVVALVRKLGAVSTALVVVVTVAYIAYWFVRHHPNGKIQPDNATRKLQENSGATSQQNRAGSTQSSSHQPGVRNQGRI